MPGKNWHEVGPGSAPAACGTTGGAVSLRLNQSAKRRVPGTWPVTRGSWTVNRGHALGKMNLDHSPPTVHLPPKYWLPSNPGARDFADADRGLNQRPGRSSGGAEVAV